MIRKIAVLLFLGLAALNAYGGTFGSSFSIYIRGGFEFFGPEGSESEYSYGVNPFPVVPSHQAQAVGLSLLKRLGSSFEIELGGNYCRPKSLKLIDPSDKDELSYKTLETYDAQLAVLYNITSTRVKPYALLGAGISFTRGKPAEWVTTRLGYKVYLEEARNGNSTFVLIGGGLKIYLSAKSAFRVDALYKKFTQEKRTAIVLMGGIIIGF
jgi:hypothetical protein